MGIGLQENGQGKGYGQEGKKRGGQGERGRDKERDKERGMEHDEVQESVINDWKTIH
jgi:hypothetical protein